MNKRYYLLFINAKCDLDIVKQIPFTFKITWTTHYDSWFDFALKLINYVINFIANQFEEIIFKTFEFGCNLLTTSS